jgi:hypothetical protein
MWLTENPWPPMVLLGLVAAALAWVWVARRRGAMLIGAIAALLGCVAVYYIERAIVTDAERLEADLYRLVSAFQHKDREGTLSMISQQAPEWRTMAAVAIDLVDVRDDLDVKDVSVKIYGENSQALTHFRANGTFSYRGQGTGHYPSRWELRWQREGADWKVVEVTRLNPLREEKLAIFDQRSP